MIEKSKLKEICNTYKIDNDRLINTNENVLKYGEYYDICYVLDFLRDELNIEPGNIEKCPSILYRGVENIRSNYEFLKKEQITRYDVEGCLHILSTEPSELKRTYQYIIENYGIRYLNAQTSILRININRIKEIEKNFPEFKKKNVLQAACSKWQTEEIKKIVKVCKENGIKLTGGVFRKSAEEIEKIVEVCRKNKISVTANMFLSSAEKIEKTIKFCKENKIEITGSIFQRSLKQLQENIDYIHDNYGDEYLKTLIVTKNIKNLKTVMPYLQKKCVLDVLQKSSMILSLTLDEIKERESFLKSIGENIINQDGTKFNLVFGLSKKRYLQRVEKEKNKEVEL